MALPKDHVLKSLETRMLEMATDMGPLMVAGGNFVAALRVFADKHPTLHDLGRCGEAQYEDYLSRSTRARYHSGCWEEPE